MKPTSNRPDREAFCDHVWPEMVHLYADARVEKLCLGLQHDFDVDIPLFLFLWLADEAGQGASPAEVIALLNGGARWRNEVVRPLRAARVNLRELTDLPNVPDFRADVRRMELRAERLHVDQICEAFAAMSGPGGLAPRYLSECGLLEPDALNILSDVASAAKKHEVTSDG